MNGLPVLLGACVLAATARANVPPPQVTHEGAMQMLAAAWRFSGPSPKAEDPTCLVSLLPETPDHGARTQIAGECDTFPILKKVFAWDADTALGFTLEDANFEPLLVFHEEGQNMAFTATGPDGQVFQMMQERPER